VPEISEIRIYPVKALDGIAVPEAAVAATGALRHDREWAIVDAQGRFVNGKRTPAEHGLRAGFDLDAFTVRLNGAPSLSLLDETAGIEQLLSRHFGEPVKLVCNAEGGYPDDTDSPGPTLVSRASLEAAAGWFGWDVESARRRFRANLEVDGVPAFWEDRLYGQAFRIGEIELEAVNPCQRCVVPSRDPGTGDQQAGFQKEFARLREANLPEWAVRSAFSHFYRFTVNTRIPAEDRGKVLRVSDPVRFSE
jgi:hypothetical protein